METLDSNRIQIELIKHSKIQCEVWVERFAKKFRELLDMHIISPNSNLIEIENILYK